MRFRYSLPPHIVQQAASLAEFANGGTQCHAQLKDGSVHAGLLLSGGQAIIAMRGVNALPFQVSEIDRLFQEGDDASPGQRDGWKFFDDWTT